MEYYTGYYEAIDGDLNDIAFVIDEEPFDTADDAVQAAKAFRNANSHNPDRYAVAYHVDKSGEVRSLYIADMAVTEDCLTALIEQAASKYAEQIDIDHLELWFTRFGKRTVTGSVFSTTYKALQTVGDTGIEYRTDTAEEAVQVAKAYHEQLKRRGVDGTAVAVSICGTAVTYLYDSRDTP